MSDDKEAEAWRQRLYGFTFERCLHNDGQGHDRWLTCWRCAKAFTDAEANDEYDQLMVMYEAAEADLDASRSNVRLLEADIAALTAERDRLREALVASRGLFELLRGHVDPRLVVDLDRLIATARKALTP